jgi:hypothetical protein
MKKAIFLGSLIILPNAVCQSPTCHGKPLDSESTVLQILETSSPSETNSDLRQCVTGAIEYASELRSQAAIPQLIRYLSFSKDLTVLEKHGFLLHPPLEGDDYPAVLALARIGTPARPALLQVMQSDSVSLLEQKERRARNHSLFHVGPRPRPQ